MKKFGNLIKKILFLLLSFSLNVFAVEFKTEEIIIPKNLFMVRKDAAKEIEAGYKYTITYKKYSNKNILPKKFDLINTPEKLLATLLYSYKIQSKKLMFSLFAPPAQKSLNRLDPKQLNKQMNIFKNLIQPKLTYAFKYKDGIILSWTDQSFVKSRKVFIKAKNNVYKIYPFHSSSGETYFWNVNMYLEGGPFLYSTPKKIQSFEEIKDGEQKKIVFLVNKKGNYVHLFKKFDSPVNLSLKDNYRSQNSSFYDLNEDEKVIEVSLDGKNFSHKGKSTLYYIESNFPLSYIPIIHKKMTGKLMINKVSQ